MRACLSKPVHSPSPPTTSAESSFPMLRIAQALDQPVALPRWGLWTLAAVACVALTLSYSQWRKLTRIQQQLAHQSAQAQSTSQDARTTATHALELARDATTRVQLGEARLNEYTLQRSHLEQLAFDISRNWERNLLVELETSLRLAQQQAQLTGLADPLIAALRTATQRLERNDQPRLLPLQTAIDRDLQRLTNAVVTDTTGLLARMDRLLQHLSSLPLLSSVGDNSVTPPPSTAQANDAGPQAPTEAPANSPTATGEEQPPLWRKAWRASVQEMRQLFRIQRIDHPDAVLLSAEQAFFLRENLRLQLMNARMGLITHQSQSVRADLASAEQTLKKYFDPRSPQTQQALQILSQLQAHAQAVELPTVAETLAALRDASAAANRQPPAPLTSSALQEDAHDAGSAQAAADRVGSDTRSEGR